MPVPAEATAPPSAVAPPGGPSKTPAEESFPVAWLLPRRSRPAVHAVYAFARTADDIADTPDLTPAEKLACLDALETALMKGTGPAVGTRVHAVLAAQGVDTDILRPLLDAFRRDARGTPCADWADLMAYCELSAVPVGRVLLALFGEKDPGACAAADALCRALQVLNHVQDCAKDWQGLNRCYLPQDWMAVEGCTTGDLDARIATPALRRVLDRTLVATDSLLADAAPLPARVAARGLRAQSAATLSVSHALARRLRAHDPVAAALRPTRGDWLRALAAGLSHGLWRRAS